MKTLLVSDQLHKEWKIYCSKKSIKILDATEIALNLAMKKKIIKK